MLACPANLPYSRPEYPICKVGRKVCFSYQKETII